MWSIAAITDAIETALAGEASRLDEEQADRGVDRGLPVGSVRTVAVYPVNRPC